MPDLKLAMATVSMGWHPSHTLEIKLDAAKQHGIQGIELVDKDLDRFAEAHSIGRLEAADKIGQLCRQAQITIISYAAFELFEGQPTPLPSRLDKAREWCEIAQRAGTRIIQVPSNFDTHAMGDQNVIVTDLQALADLGSQRDPPISFAYEALAWGTHVADWEESLNIVELVDRENFGLCLDTYHVLARLWADPTTYNGRRPGGDSALRASLQRFRETCPAEKILYIQLSDAEHAKPPILPGHPAYSEHEHATHSWCMYGRLLPFEEEYGAYLPMQEIVLAWLVESKWQGWVSMEVFHRDMKEQSSTPEQWAKRAKHSWEKIQLLIRNQERLR